MAEVGFAVGDDLALVFVSDVFAGLEVDDAGGVERQRFELGVGAPFVDESDDGFAACDEVACAGIAEGGVGDRYFGGDGVDLPAVFVGLETEGVEKFVEAWDDLIENVKKALG